MSDLISRQEAYKVLTDYYHHKTEIQHMGLKEALNRVPSAQPTQLNTPNTLEALDCISRKDAIDALERKKDRNAKGDIGGFYNKIIQNDIDTLMQLPSAQPEPLSDAYMKAVLTWLLDYQIKASELEGRYTPYEVLSWVANDWRKEHERFDKQTGGD